MTVKNVKIKAAKQLKAGMPVSCVVALVTALSFYVKDYPINPEGLVRNVQSSLRAK
jgi:hypothetical protein